MADSQDEKSVPLSTELIVAEYTALREEILKLTDVQTQFVVITLAIFGTVLTVGTQIKNAPILFVYPLLAYILALSWVNNAHGIDLLGLYIQEKIESKVGVDNIGWEHYLHRSPSTYTLIAFWGARLIFVVTQILALFVGAAIAFPGFGWLNIILLLQAIVFIVLCARLISKMSQTHGKGKRLVG